MIQQCCAWSLSHIWLSATAQTVAHQAPLSKGILQWEYWSGLPCPPPGDLPNSGMEPGSPALQANTLPAELPRKPQDITKYCANNIFYAILSSSKRKMFLLISWDRYSLKGEKQIAFLQLWLAFLSPVQNLNTKNPGDLLLFHSEIKHCEWTFHT